MTGPPQPPPAPSAQPPSPPSDVPFHGTHPARHYGALAVVVLSSLALALPPRRLDARNGVMGLFLLWGTEQLVHDSTGAGLLERAGRRMAPVLDAGLPERARRNKVLMEAERARREAAARSATAEAPQEGWKEERARREKEALESGKGVSGLIMDQIWEVWNQENGKKKPGENKGETSGSNGRNPKKPE